MITQALTHKPFLIQHYFERAVAGHPDKVAVTCGQESLTYAELDARSNAIARALLAAGAGKGKFVPFLMPKSVDSICAMLGILKAGCGYVPLDVDSPEQRLVSILRTTNARCLVVNTAGCERLVQTPSLGDGIVVIDCAVEADTAPLAPSERISVDVAYVLFTSGSTGAPKGVMIPHQAIIDYIDWCVVQYSVTDKDNVANHAPLYFDNSTFDIYTAFAAGATLHLVPPSLNAVLPRLVTWLSEKQISVFFCVPSVLTLLLRSRRLQRNSFPALRELVFAGEVVQADVLTEWMRLFPHVRFTNMYGPTEITVDCTYHVVQSPPGNEPVPIGRARPNMELYVYTETEELSQAIGATGELWVRGLSVGYGYLGDAAKTSAAFVQHPDSPFPDRLYRTGDVVRIREDGALMFLGRADQQIKYLGHRIELGEIEAQLQALEQVTEAVVVFRHGDDAGTQAIGALVSTAMPCTSAQILDALKARVPTYMLPRRLLCTEEPFPRTANGKYDRKAVLALVFGE